MKAALVMVLLVSASANAQFPDPFFRCRTHSSYVGFAPRERDDDASAIRKPRPEENPRQATPYTPPEPALVTARQCAEGASCPPGQSCATGRCTTPPPAPASAPEAPFRAVECSDEVPCGGRQSCVKGRCVSPPPPESSLERRRLELVVRQHERQLRQDLALGEGPVINELAAFRRVSPRELGRLMRANQRSLSQTLGDGPDATWPARFLERVDELTVSLSPRGRGSG